LQGKYNRINYAQRYQKHIIKKLYKEAAQFAEVLRKLCIDRLEVSVFLCFCFIPSHFLIYGVKHTSHIHSLTFSFNLVPCFTTNYAAELVILVQFLSVSNQPFSPNHDKITFGD
jgi:hypothetical protein